MTDTNKSNSPERKSNGNYRSNGVSYGENGVRTRGLQSSDTSSIGFFKSEKKRDQYFKTEAELKREASTWKWHNEY